MGCVVDCVGGPVCSRAGIEVLFSVLFEWVSEVQFGRGMSTSSSSQRCGSATVRFMMTFRVSAASSNSIP